MHLRIIAFLLAAISLGHSQTHPQPGGRIVMIGNTLGERMINFPDFEVELHLRYPSHNLTLRNLCVPGDTPAFRPRAGRKSQWAFPGAEVFRPEFRSHLGNGFEFSPDEWLKHLQADTILAFFGFNESFDGPAGVANFEAELDAFAVHTLAQKTHGDSPPRLVLVSPIAFEDRSDERLNLPDGVKENANLALYTDAIRRVAAKHDLTFVDLFTPTLAAFQKKSGGPFTINGCHLNAAGYAMIAPVLANQAFGQQPVADANRRDPIRKAVDEKNWHWFNDYRIPNGVHVFGRRHRPFGGHNYPAEIEKLRQMIRLRDEAIWQIASGNKDLVEVDDSQTRELPVIETNYRQPIEYLEGNASLQRMKLADNFEASVFVSEEHFPNLSNPVHMAFDNRGRLWVATTPSYPHYRPGDAKPDDKILIYEDTNGDGSADKETVFADGLHIPMGFSIAAEGVYVAQQPNLVLMVDENGDGRADRSEILLHGFCTHDTHHSIGAFATDGAGALYFCEGLFLHSQVETPYGAVRGTGAAIFRFDPRTFRLERHVQSAFANPWGIAFDEWGQLFIADASGGQHWWALPLSARAPHGHNIGKSGNFVPRRSRPTAGAEFLYSRHFPDEMQGDWMVNNCIGFHGTTLWSIGEDGIGFSGKVRLDLLESTDKNFRPVSMEIAPDGSLYVLDWHNALVGHMQHSIRDPNRDHRHGRIYRIAHQTRPLVTPPNIEGAEVEHLLENLKLPEMRARTRSHRELRKHAPSNVMPALAKWVQALDASDPRFEHHLVEALSVAWGQRRIHADLIARVLTAQSHHARAAAAQVLRHEFREVDGAVELLLTAANDTHPRVRLEAMAAASWMDSVDGVRIAMSVLNHPMEKSMGPAFEAAMLSLKPHVQSYVTQHAAELANNSAAREYLSGKLKIDLPEAEKIMVPEWLKGDARDQFTRGHEVYHRSAHCATCHGADGKGDGKFYPPLTPNPWVTGKVDRLVKLTLKGIWGPMEIDGVKYSPENGVPPMTPFEGLLDDAEVAAVLTFVRNSFGNQSSPVTEHQVSTIRKETEGKVGFYTVDELLQAHPLEAP